jgi:hypothetical protein
VNTTKAMRELIDDAIAVGHEVEESVYEVRIPPLKRGRPGITIYQDGTAVRNDVSDLCVCTAIRTQKQMRKLLDLHVGLARLAQHEAVEAIDITSTGHIRVSLAVGWWLRESQTSFSTVTVASAEATLASDAVSYIEQ